MVLIRETVFEEISNFDFPIRTPIPIKIGRCDIYNLMKSIS